MIHRRDFLAAGGALALSPALQAQSFPNRAIQMVIPYPAGGTTDVMARAMVEPLQRSLGQPVIIENKSGAAGVLGAREVAQGKPDGHMLLFVNSGILAVTPHVQKDAGFDGVKSFAPVALVTVAPLFVIVPGDLPVTDLRSFIEYARKQPKPLAYATAGIGSFGHLATELFLRTAGLSMTHVPYRGQAPTTNAVLTGEVSLLITSMSANMRAFLDSGKLKLLATTAAPSSPQTPGVPTVASVLPGYEAETWFGFVTTAGTPPAVVDRLNREINLMLDTPAMRERMQGLGQQLRTTTPARLGEMIAQDNARWGTVVREAGINLN